jgi:hypothetical protein
MAAEQVPGLKLCECGCGQPVEFGSRKRQSRYTLECAVRIAAEKRAIFAKRYQRSQKYKDAQKARRASRSAVGEANEAAKRRSLHPRQIQVYERPELVRNRSQKPCLSCGGMPWARDPRRLDEHERRVAVIPPHTGIVPLPVCRGCGEEWAEEPEQPMVSVLGSSMATCVKHGKFFGLDIADGRGPGKARK